MTLLRMFYVAPFDRQFHCYTWMLGWWHTPLVLNVPALPFWDYGHNDGERLEGWDSCAVYLPVITLELARWPSRPV